MKTKYTKRKEVPESYVNLCEMKFGKGPTVTLDFGKKEKKLKLGTAFIADAIEHYITISLEKYLEYRDATKKRKK